MKDFPESDWKKLRVLHDTALARLCERILEEVVQTARRKEKSTHERYRDVYRLIKDRDSDIALAFNGSSRSNALQQLCAMVTFGLLTPEEIATFTPETQKRVGHLKRL